MTFLIQCMCCEKPIGICKIDVDMTCCDCLKPSGKLKKMLDTSIKIEVKD
jgi:hypothetical protein